MSRIYYILFGILLVTSGTAQDKIYYKKSKPDDWKVTEITPEYIKGIDAKNPKITYSTTHSNVLFVFNSLGNFLVIPKLFGKNPAAEAYVRQFFERLDNKFNEYDKIITVNSNIIVCNYENESGKKIEYTAASKKLQIPRSEVAVIIFKNGEHKLLASLEKVYKTLSEVQDLYIELASTEKPASSEGEQPSADSALAVKALAENNEGESVPGNSKRTDENSSVNESTPATDSGSAPSAVTATREEKKEKNLDSATLLRLQDKAITNIKQLESYIKLICNKNTGIEEVEKAVELALTLFINEESKIEVSSINTGNIQQYRVSVYLNRLAELKYDNVDIRWYNVQYTSQLRKGPDGYYYGIIEFEQRFAGISGDKRVYEDVTRKKVEIVLKTYKRTVEGRTTLEWDVFLGDIGVTVTKPA